MCKHFVLIRRIIKLLVDCLHTYIHIYVSGNAYKLADNICSYVLFMEISITVNINRINKWYGWVYICLPVVHPVGNIAGTMHLGFHEITFTTQYKLFPGPTTTNSYWNTINSCSRAMSFFFWGYENYSTDISKTICFLWLWHLFPVVRKSVFGIKFEQFLCWNILKFPEVTHFNTFPMEVNTVLVLYIMLKYVHSLI